MTETMSDMDLVRMNIDDYPAPAIDTDIANGEAKLFTLTHKHIQNYSVYVNGSLVTNYEIDEKNGTLVFDEAPASSATIRIEYEYSAFTDEDLESLFLRFTTINAVTVQCIKILLVDASRRFDYTYGQTKISASQVFKQLKEMLEIYQDDLSPVILDRTHAEYYPTTTDTSNEEDLTRDDSWGL